AFIAHQDGAVIVEFTAFHERGEVGAKRVDFESGDITGEVFSVGADVPDASGGAAAFRVGAPGGLFLSGRLDVAGEPALRVLDDYFAKLAKASITDEL